MRGQVWAEVVSVGSELVLGQLVDTNAAAIARALAEIGVGLGYHTTVGDDRDRLVEVLHTALSRGQVVITTGGIGPTEDDLTREAAAEVLGRELVFIPELLQRIEGFFQRLGYRMPENNRRQAFVPAGAEVIDNPRGTAPAFACEEGDRTLICLPGVPRETEPLLREAVLPRLESKYGLGGRVWLNRVLKVCGLGESGVDAQLREVIRSLDNPRLGLQASPGEIAIRLTARGGSRAEAEARLDAGEAAVREKVGGLIFGQGEETLAGNTARRLEDLDLTLAVADGVSRGLACAELGRELSPGRLRGGLILAESALPAELCARVRAEFGAEVALALAGLADQDRVRVEILVQGPEGREGARTLSLGGPGHLIRQRAATMALFTLWRFLGELGGD